MRIDLGAPVRTKDGHGAGHVKKAIWDPKSNQIIGYVVATGGLLGHEAVVSPSRSRPRSAKATTSSST